MDSDSTDSTIYYVVAGVVLVAVLVGAYYWYHNYYLSSATSSGLAPAGTNNVVLPAGAGTTGGPDPGALGTTTGTTSGVSTGSTSGVSSGSTTTSPVGSADPHAGMTAITDTDNSIFYLPTDRVLATQSNYGKNTDDEATGTTVSSALAAWAKLTREDKIAMAVPDYMRDPAYTIVYDPNFSYLASGPSSEPTNCTALCNSMKNCKAPFFLGRMGNYCYAQVN